MKFLAIGTVKGQCCDYGWGTRGNTDYEIFEAKSMEEAKKKIFEENEDGDYSNLSYLTDSEFRPRGESLTIYAVSDEFEFDIKAMQTQDAAERKALAERRQREEEEREFLRLKEKLGK